MSGAVFILDDDRSTPSPNSSPKPSPPTSRRGSPVQTSTSEPFESSPLSQQVTNASTASIASALSVPQQLPPPVLLPHPKRPHGASFAATTPSFPSPLARASIVPRSDSSSSSRESGTGSDDDEVIASSNASGTPKRKTEPYGSIGRKGSPSTRSNSPTGAGLGRSRPESPVRLPAQASQERSPSNAVASGSSSRQAVVTPSGLLRSKRSSSGSNLLNNMTAEPARAMAVLGAGSGIMRLAYGSPSTSESRSRSGSTSGASGSGSQSGQEGVHIRQRSGSGGSQTVAGRSPLAFGSPDLGPIEGEDLPPMPVGLTSSVTGTKGKGKASDESNLLGLGYGPTSELGRSQSLRGDEAQSPSSSPKRNKERLPAVPNSPRQRRQSDFLQPSHDNRRLSIASMSRPLMANPQTAAALSTSASMISPLNPLPSPWATSNDNGNSLSPSTSYSSDLSSGLGSVGSSNGLLGAGSGAMRLNRVPTSVRLASDLIKNSTPLSPPSVSGGHSNHPSISGSAGSPPVLAGHRRELSSFSSLPSSPPTAQSLDGSHKKLGLTVPPTPSATRNVTPEEPPNATLKEAAATAAMPPPPTSFKPPSQILPKSRPSLPAPASFNPGTLGEPFTGVSRHSKFRTSVHEPGYSPTDLTGSPPSWISSSGGESAPSSISVATRKRSPFGLGLEMPPARPTAGAGSLASESTLRQAFDSGRKPRLAIDLAGLGTMGDASQHATMIMQSRQAKMHRWRPGSAGNRDQPNDQPLSPPPFNRSTTYGAPALLAARRATRQAAWGLEEPSATSASSPADQVPPQLLSGELTRVATLPSGSQLRDGDIADVKGRRAAQTDNSRLSGFGTGVPMARDGSTSGSVNGIEWVDWLDEYKMYKEAKIRAEQAETEAARVTLQGASMRSGSQDLMLTPVPDEDSGDMGERRVRDDSPEAQVRQRFPSAGDLARENTISLTPTTSREDVSLSGQPRKRSMSIRSTLSAFEPKLSPIQRRGSLFEKPRQASNSSLRSNDTMSTAGNGRKKKNLVMKMEGWWNAVKSNFTPETGGLPSRPAGPTTLKARIPSAPQSRRISAVNPGQSPVTSLPPVLLHPGPVRRDSASSVLRNATSHTEIRPRVGIDKTPSQAPAGISSSRSADLSRLSSSQSPESYLREPFTRTSVSPILSTISSFSTQPDRSASGLEARRKQPHLSLKLEPHILGLDTRGDMRGARSIHSLHGRDGSDGTSGIMPAPPSHGTSRASSYGQSLHGPGLTPGVHKWDITPSPVYSLQTDGRNSPEDIKTSVPPTDITVNSVRRHIKHRLASAKETCDQELRKVVNAIASFVEEQIRLDQVEGIEDDEQASRSHAAGNESPIEVLDSDEDAVDLAEGSGARRGNTLPVPSSRSSSRRNSLSRPVNPSTSPLKRRDSSRGPALPQSPNRVARRRLSIAQRPAQTLDVRSVARSLNLNPERSHSSSSSRSTSRSRSPMPAQKGLLPGHSIDDTATSLETPLMNALQEIISIATDILDTPTNVFVSKPASCQQMVQKVQKVGQAWDGNPDWPGRGWYVQLLLAVAGLSRVVEWWEAEKGFWNFDDDDQDEPLLFVMKPAREEQRFEQSFKTALDSARSSPAVSAAPLPRSDSPAVASSDNEGRSQYSDQRSQSTTPAPVLTAERPKAQAAEELRLMAEHAKSVNIVMELSLGGEIIEWVNPAWREVIGTEPADAFGQPIADMLAPADASTFQMASMELEKDDSHTVEARFRFQMFRALDTQEEDREPGPIYIELEGIGMLMRDRDTSVATHTMWVIKPVLRSSVPDGHPEMPLPSGADFAGHGASTAPTTYFAQGGLLTHETLLCRICERQVPTWFFEKHNETCNEEHRLEADITACNERLTDLCQVVQKLNVAIDEADASRPAEYQGLVVFSLPASVMDLNASPVISQPHLVATRKVQHGLLEEAINVLTAAHEISTPSVKDEDTDTPVQAQRVLSPNSEERLSQVARWKQPSTDDLALALLLSHVDAQVRQKQIAVNRMRNTILYSERVRQEWEDQVDRMLAIEEESTGSSASSLDTADVNEGGDSGDQGAPSLSRHRDVTPLARLPVTKMNARSSPNQSTSEPLSPTARIPTSRKSVSSTAQRVDEAQTSPTTCAPSRLGSPLLSLPAKPEGHHARRVSTSSRHLEAPLSPRIPAVVPQSRTAATSIKDFEIIKPISRGAFGSVYLAKKVATGDYFAIKALKKSDMIAKNQITNVKAERTILMNQASSPYVVKLFFSFQSKDYLYLVMEYLNGGDCASLIKTLGGLSEDWARNYIAEVVLGLEYLHAKGVVHRDIKPDNLLIDSRGHLKLTDFGLSRIGLLNRQVGGPRPAVLRGTSLGRARAHRRFQSQRGSSTSSADSPLLSPEVNMPTSLSNLAHSYFGNYQDSIGSADESTDSESPGAALTERRSEHLRTLSTATKSTSDGWSPSGNREAPKFVGTPDYLSPESILGIGGDNAVVDWWALGVVLYEFLYGFPPFHADSPEKVFDNVISRRIQWHEEDVEVSAEAHDLMNRLMCSDPTKRLGSRGAAEVKCHAFFAGINWDTITTDEASFVPDVTDPESTDYFDSRGAVTQVFHDDDNVIQPPVQLRKVVSQANDPAIASDDSVHAESDDRIVDDFGTFNFKNLPVLKQANDDVIRKLRVDQMLPMSQALDPASTPVQNRRRSVSMKLRARAKSRHAELSPYAPPSPDTSTSSAASTPSRGSGLPITPVATGPLHYRRPSELNALDRVKSSEDSDAFRRASAPSRLRASSVSSNDKSVNHWEQSSVAGLGPTLTSDLSQSEAKRDLQTLTTSDRTLDVLIAEDNPISQKILETLLTRMGCRCVCVNDGAEALAATMGSIQFDVIICDIHMPNVSGEQVARMIRSTNNANVNTPIIAATSYEQYQSINEEGTVFSAVLSKPVSKQDLTRCLGKLGFILSVGTDS